MADQYSEPREVERETVVVEQGDKSHSGAGLVVAIIAIIVILFLVFGVFGGSNEGDGGTTNVDINAPTQDSPSN